MKCCILKVDRRVTSAMSAIAGETRSPARMAGEGPRATVCKAASVYRRARACPSPCLDREGNGFGWRSVFARVERSRGTGPRATVCQAASLHRRARACPSLCLDREENGLSLRSVFARVGRSRGTGPRATVDEMASRLTRSGSGDPELQFPAIILLIVLIL